MKKLSIDNLVETVHRLRKEKRMTQAQLAAATGINRAMIGRMENKDYVPTIEQLQALHIFRIAAHQKRVVLNLCGEKQLSVLFFGLKPQGIKNSG